MLNKTETLVISGGGIKGVAALGAISILEKKLNFKKIVNFIGCSSGSFICFLLSVSFLSKNIEKFFKKLSLSSFITFSKTKPSNFLSSFGIIDTTLLELIVNKVLEKKFHMKNVSFAELKKLTGKKFCCIATDLNTSKLVIFDYKRTPNVYVKDAIMASCSIPLLFKPVKIDNMFCVDGGIKENFPFFITKNIKHTIGIHLYGPLIKNPKTIFQFLKLLSQNMIRKTYLDEIEMRTIKICCNCNFIENKISEKLFSYLWTLGEKTTVEFFR